MSITPIEACGCCDGVGRATPQSAVQPAGAVERSATASAPGPTFARAWSPVCRATARPALSKLLTRDGDDFTIGLIDAFACSCRRADLLPGAHRQRELAAHRAPIASSLQEMGRLIGYRLRPGVAAETWLAFTLETPPVAPAALQPEPGAFVTGVPASITLPAGLQGAERARPGREAADLRDRRGRWPTRARRGTRCAPGSSKATLLAKPATPPSVWTACAPVSRRATPSCCVRENFLADPAGGVESWDFRILSAVVTPTPRTIARASPSCAAGLDPAAGQVPHRLRAAQAGRGLRPQRTDVGQHAGGLQGRLPGRNGRVQRRLHERLARLRRQQQAPRRAAPPGSTWTASSATSPPAAWPSSPRATSTTRAPAVRHLDRALRRARHERGVARRVRAVGQGDAARAGRRELPRTGSTNVPREIAVFGAVRGAGAGRRTRSTTEVSGDDAAARASPAAGLRAGPAPDRARHAAPDGAAIGCTSTTHRVGITVAGHALRRSRSTRRCRPRCVRDSVVVHANVALASHGETVTQILGSGSAAQPFARFELKQLPLTYRAAATDIGAARRDHAARRRHRVDRAPDAVRRRADRARVSRWPTDAAGKLWARFGDGLMGARLPSGAEQCPRHLSQGPRRGRQRAGRQPDPAGLAPARLEGRRQPGCRRSGGTDPERRERCPAHHAAHDAHARSRGLAARLRGLCARVRRRSPRRSAEVLRCAAGRHVVMTVAAEAALR